MLNREEILALFDREQRRDVVYPGARREALSQVVRHVNKGAEQSFVLYTELDVEQADAEIDAQIDYFQRIGSSFEWKVFDHDRPADLRMRLERRGFQIGEPEAVMALDLRHAPPRLLAPIDHDIRSITDPQDLDDVSIVENAVWNRDFGATAARLAADLRDAADALSIYVAYVQGAPAAAAWIYFHSQSHFASLWGGSTIAQYRRRGLYTALLAIRRRQALARGYRFLTVDASPMSRPILENQGFVCLTYAHACSWNKEETLC